MELITGVGATDHIDSQDDADFQRAITGPDNYVLNIGRKMEAELLSNNVVRVHDGSLIHQGRHVIIPEGESEEVTIEYGTQVEKRIDLIVSVYRKDTTSGIETEFLKAIKGTPSVDIPAIPSHIDGNIRAGDIYSEFPLYKVTLDGINIVSIDPLYEVLTSMAELKTMTDELNRNLSEGFSPLTSDSNGIYRHPSGLMLQWGIYPSAAMTKNDGVGGYLGKIKFKESFAGTPQCFTTCHYWGGNTQTGTQDISSASVTLYSKSAATDLGVRWLALGSWK